MTAATQRATVRVFHLPDLGEGLTEGEIVSWAVAVGDRVEVDQVIAVVETAKAAVDLPCPYAGTVVTLHGAEGEVLDVGAPLISIDTGGGGGGASGEPGEPVALEATGGAVPDEPADDARSDGERDAQDQGSGNVLIGYGTSAPTARRRRSAGGAGGVAIDADPAAPVEPETADEVPSKPGGRVRVISPLVRRLAAEHGIDLRTLEPSGPRGIILRADVEAAIGRAGQHARGEVGGVPAGGVPAASGVPAGGGVPESDGLSPADVTVPMSLGQRTMAQRLATSRREIPDATTWVDVDATGLLAMRADLAAAWPDAKIGVLALMGRIVVAGLRRFPELNARAELSVDGHTGTLTRYGAVHLSFAAQGPRGLVVPVVHRASAMTTAELAAALRDLTARAREGTLSPTELTGGTFTLNNYGGYGVDGSTPIINHPEAGMLGLGRIIDKPWVVDGALAVRKVTQLSLTFDHRVCDGAVAGGFLRFVADCVERPGVLVGTL